MVVVLVLSIGGPLLVVAGALLSVALTRISAARAPGSFRCKVRVDTNGQGLRDGARPKPWPRRATYAIWARNALVVTGGLARTVVRPLAVHFAEGSVSDAARAKVSGLGRNLVVLSLELDDGTHAALAAPRAAGQAAAGPYVSSVSLGSE